MYWTKYAHQATLEYVQLQIFANEVNILYRMSILSCPQVWLLNPLKKKRRLLYLKTRFVPGSKHF